MTRIPHDDPTDPDHYYARAVRALERISAALELIADDTTRIADTLDPTPDQED